MPRWLTGSRVTSSDEIIHPVVQAIVGLHPTLTNTATADGAGQFICKLIKGVELRSRTAGLFAMCSDPADGNRINPLIQNFCIPVLRPTILPQRMV